MSSSPPTSAPKSKDECDGTCVGLAVGLGLLFFIIGALLICYFKDYIAPKKKTKDGAEEHKGGDNGGTDSDGVDLEANHTEKPEEPENGSGKSSLSINKQSSNNEQVIEITDIEANGVDTIRRKPTSNNESVVDDASIHGRRGRKSNNEEFVDASDLPRTSNNEQPVDPAAVRPYRKRRTSSNNERPVDMFEIQQGPPPSEEDVEAARKRAASLERKLEEVSKMNGILKENARRLQQDIAELSARNNEMQLDKV